VILLVASANPNEKTENFLKNRGEPINAAAYKCLILFSRNH
jgi:hypothetical protein